MSKKYEFDKEYFRKLLNKGQKLLSKPYLDDYERFEIEFDIHFINKVLDDSVSQNDDYESGDEEELSYHEIKKEWISYLKKIYKILGEQNINLLIDLNDSEIFNLTPYEKKEEVALEEQEFITLKTYEKHSKILLKHAKNILSPYPTYQIHQIHDYIGDSYEHYSFLADLPFIVVKPSSGSFILNHELQHGIEDILGINSNGLYGELGSILFELLNTDMFYKERGFIFVDSYASRIEDSDLYLDDFTNIFKIMKDLAKSKFIVSDGKFKKILSNYFTINDDEDLSYYLLEEYSEFQIQLNLTYLLSHLKAIELREQLKNSKGDILNILTKCISKSEIDFNLTEDKFNLYKRYIDEMESKIRSNILF